MKTILFAMLTVLSSNAFAVNATTTVCASTGGFTKTVLVGTENVKTREDFKNIKAYVGIDLYSEHNQIVAVTDRADIKKQIESLNRHSDVCISGQLIDGGQVGQLLLISSIQEN